MRDDPAAQTEREQVLSILADQIRSLDDRIDDYEIENSDDERMLIRWTRALGYLSGQYRKLMKDEDIDEMEADLDLVKAAQEVGDR
ncbi:hypothetical protein [Halorussus litoreus]|uniref:hypothetical protein n=1 Tax=Halorussus litoreus TaxID=1710536 RepID=UPI000E279E4C|nr:hypothetical protein [Halorussus litoreus]